MAIGGILGGVLVSQPGHADGTTAAIIVGVLLGGAIGGAAGRSMDDADRLKTAHSLETVRAGVLSRWNTPDSGNSYTVVLIKKVETASGPCREYTIDAIVAGELENAITRRSHRKEIE